MSGTSAKGHNVSRRGFLSGTAAAVAGIAATSVLSTTGCTPEPTAEPEQKETPAKEFWNPNPQDDSWSTYTTDYSAIFQPVQIGPLTLKNHIIKGSAGSDTTNKAEQKLPCVPTAALEYHKKIAAGGAAAIVLEATTLSYLGMAPNTSASTSSLATTDEAEQIAAAKVLADAIHEYDCKILYRFRAPSTGIVDLDVAGKSKEFLQNFFDSCGDCARKLKLAGYDGCEIKAATTDVASQFLSVKYNTRDDEFGPQSIENRARLMTEQIKAIRNAVGTDFAIFCVLNACEENDQNLGDNQGYLTFEECKLISKELEKAGADLIELRAGGASIETSSWAPDNAHAGYERHGMTAYGTRLDYNTHWSGIEDGSHDGIGTFLPAAEQLKKVLSIPVGCISTDPRLAPDMMNNAVRDGRVDLLVLNRCINADFDLPNKLKEGRRDEVAPCCRCLHCHTAGFTPKTAERCRVNAGLQIAYRESMPEGYDPLPAETVKNVMVIGAGPAGMEAARIAAQRGHKVTLYEKSGSLGGLVKTAHAYKGEHEQLGDLIAYLTKQQEIKGVAVVKNFEVTLDTVKDQNPDVVVVAVGGKRRELPLASTENINVLGFDEVASAKIGERVVILGAGAQAIDLCMYLQAQGKIIQMVNPGEKSDIDKEQSRWYQTYIIPDLYATGVKIWNQATINSLSDEGLVIDTAYDYGSHVLPCDTVIDVWDMEANETLAKQIESAGFTVYSVGDCASPWNIQQAISTGNLAARKF